MTLMWIVAILGSVLMFVTMFLVSPFILIAEALVILAILLYLNRKEHTR